MVDAGIEEDVGHQLVQQRPTLPAVRLIAFSHSLEPAPVVRHRSPAVRDNPTHGREVTEKPRRHGLHECRRVGAEIVRTREVEVRVTGRADMHHRRHVEFTHRLEQRVPVRVEQRRPSPVSARRIRVEVAANEAHLFDAAAQLTHRRLNIDARRLRKLADRSEVVGIQIADAPHKVIAVLAPVATGVLVADVVAHPGRSRREQRHVDLALPLEP